MNKCLAVLFCIFFPLLAFADSTNGSSMSLTPPASDYSVIFLGNLFGIVDGVLHGTGSQMMGTIFSIFNSAVLALGGIVIMYTLIVGTMNTAHEGEMLGHKWSSIWIPVRSTAGLALLIPKASGYCLMQIFVMWVVVQGVGAADKVWGAALDYLNRGGVFVQANLNPESSDIATQGTLSKLSQGASSILAGQVCMLGLQKQLEAVRQNYLAAANAETPTGPCGPEKDSNGMSAFCNTAVPDFLGTIDAPSYQSAMTDAYGKAPNPIKMPMPYFTETSSPLYAFLSGTGGTGICGSIIWNPLSSFAIPNSTVAPASGISNTQYQATDSQVAQMQLISLSRATAVQQMYSNLQSVAESMVSNDRCIGTATDPCLIDPSAAFPQATNVFGVPYSASSGMPCVANSTDCTLLQGGLIPSRSPNSSFIVGAPIFNGTEFQSAISDYRGVMMPTLNLMSQQKNDLSSRKEKDFFSKGSSARINKNTDQGNSNLSESKAFIAAAKAQGWLSAGSYFFDLVKLNGSATPSSVAMDSNSGLDSSFANDISSVIDAGAVDCAGGHYAILCKWLGDGKPATASSLMSPITTLLGTVQPTFTRGGFAITGSDASTTYGFINNSIAIQLPGQPPAKGYTSTSVEFPRMQPGNTAFKYPKAPCGGLRIMGHTYCLGRPFLQGILDIMKTFSDVFTNIFAPLINHFILIVITIPISVLQQTFVTGVNYISQNPGENPIVVLAKMGVYYINAPANLYIAMITESIAAAFIPVIGPIIMGIMIIFLGLASPIIISWMGVMLTVGFVTAFYIPLLPYMIFTFGVLAWLMAVIEAMAAAPIVALAITHPEGEGILGSKGEGALMILMNVFLRPAMMIIGYIAAIALCYVSVWIINSGFSHVIGFISGSIYVGWTGLYVLFFSVVIYTGMYVSVVQKAFNLIYMLPDHVMRWVGGHAEQTGQEAAGWAQETQKQVDKAGEASEKGQSGVLEKTVAESKKAIDAIKKGTESTSGGASGSNPAPPTPAPPTPPV